MNKTKQQLLEENRALKQQIAEMQMQARNANSVLRKMASYNEQLLATLKRLQAVVDQYLQVAQDRTK